MEDLFVDLFFLDKNLFRWLDIEKRLQSHPDRRQFAKWALRYRELPPPLALEIHQPEPCKKWVANTVVCEIAVAVEAVSPDKAGDKVRNFDLKFVRPANAPQPSATEPVAWGFPLPPEVIWYSFPMNGQYSFRRDESLPGAGYVVLPDNAVQALYPIQYSNTAWRARWCSSRGKVTYTAMELRNGHQFFFNLPDNYFQGGELYRLEILAMPKGSSAPLVPGDICWQLFRGNVTSTMPVNIRLPDEVKITELFFRAGKYSIREKLNIMKGERDWTNGWVDYETDEPMDALEINGNGNFAPPVIFTMETSPFYKVRDALEGKDLFYYLTVPEVEPLDSLPLSDLAVAELDNTMNAAFIEKVNDGAVPNYIGLPGNRKTPVQLAGGYVAPPLSTAQARDTFSAQQPVPFITRIMFEKGRIPNPGMVKCRLYVGEFIQLVQAAALQKEQISRRIEERSLFFYQLEQRKAQREGRPLTITLAAIKAREIANLPPSVKLVYETKFPEAFQPHFTLFYSRLFPGSEQPSTILKISFDEK